MADGVIELGGLRLRAHDNGDGSFSLITYSQNGATPGTVKLWAPDGVTPLISGPVDAITANADGASNTRNQLAVSSRSNTFNLSTWDRLLGTTPFSLLLAGGSGNIRNTTTPTADVTITNSRGIIFAIEPTVGGGSGLSPRIQIKNDISGIYGNAGPAPGAAITSAGAGVIDFLFFGQGIARNTGADGQTIEAFPMLLPRTVRLNMNHTDSTNWQYAVYYALVP